MGRDEKKVQKREGGRGGWVEIRENLSTATPTKIPNHKTTKKNDISKAHSKQAKTAEVERNYKMFSNPVFINPGRYIDLS